MMPRVDIGELILEVMGWHPRFSAAYTHVSGGGARIGDNLDVTLAAVLTAQALNVGWGPVVTPGAEALTRSRIGHVYQNYVRAENHARANAALITGQAGIATAELWGGGLVAAVDGTRFVVPVRSIDARPNPKYFGRKKGITLLNMINDQGVGLSGLVLAGTPRDSLFAVNLMYRRDGGLRPEVFISDTGSYVATWCSGCSNSWASITGPSLPICPSRSCGGSTPAPITARWTPPREARSTCLGSCGTGLTSCGWSPRCIADRSAPRMRSVCCSAGATPLSWGTLWPTTGGSSRLCTSWPTWTENPIGEASSGCATCKKSAKAWPSTCSMVAKVSCARRITPGWKIHSARWVW